MLPEYNKQKHSILLLQYQLSECIYFHSVEKLHLNLLREAVIKKNSKCKLFPNWP